MPNLDNSELSELVDIVSAINEGRMSTKAAKFHMLIIAATKPAFKPNVFEGIADLLVKFPAHTMTGQSKHGKVDIHTRFCDQLLSSMLTDKMKKVSLGWPNKEDSLITSIRPDTVVSAVV